MITFSMPRQRRGVLINGADTTAPNSIDSTHIINGSILGTDISDLTLSEAKLETAVQNKLNTIGGVADLAVTTAKLADNAVTYDKLANNAVTNTRIANNAVTHEKLTSNCIQSHNIVDGTILGTDISNGTISQSKIDASFVAGLQEIATRIMNLEKYSIQRTLDFVVTSVSKHTINIDLLTYESVQIDFIGKFTGINFVPLKILPVNGTFVEPWNEYNGFVRYANNAYSATLTGSANNGTILQTADTNFTFTINCKIFKVYNEGSHGQRYSFTATGLYCWAGQGHAKSDILGMTSTFLPTGLNINLPNSDSIMTFSYSIINDKLITS